jgi:hypothetical protein
MQVIYAAPFILISVLAFGVCVVVPRFRHYAVQVLVAPVSFGICSIVAFAIVALTNAVITKRLGIVIPNWAVVAGCIFAYFTVGLIGAWFAAWIAGRFLRRIRALKQA